MYFTKFVKNALVLHVNVVYHLFHVGTCKIVVLIVKKGRCGICAMAMVHTPSTIVTVF